MTTDKPNILYVDDEPDNLTVFRSTFRRYYRVHIAQTAKEGLQLLTTHNMQLVITDQRMPETTGVEFLEEVLHRFPDTVRMIMTGFSDVEAIIQAINSGQVYRYITKPWDKDELRITIDNALENYSLKAENRSLVQDLQDANETLEQKVKERTTEVLAQKDIIERKNNDITDSINYAKKIQDALLPKLPTIRQVLPESFVFYQPKDIVSGDFYWFAQTNDVMAIAAVDCTGHGVPGAFMSMIGINMLNILFNVMHITEPHKLLEALHDRVVNALQQDSTDHQNSDGMDLAVCVIDKKTGHVDYAGAKNPLVYVTQSGKEGTIKADRHTIGDVLSAPTRTFSHHRVAVEEPTMFYIYSDGYQDQFGGTNNQKFLRKRLTALLQEISSKPVAEQEAILAQRLRKWRGDNAQVDDILVVGFRLSPKP